ncbi:BPL-N domain-containing protein [Cytobacillus sp. FJAT-54145]|uniref:BPL-N domain-containing protein n=1 Tax=Cytobacillus spartinae TaxID=3299023 RepID=A0ABW6KFA4_9BACI
MYKLIPMTRLGLVPYQTELSACMKKINFWISEQKEIFIVTEKFSCKTEKFPEGHIIFPGSFIVPVDCDVEDFRYDRLIGEFKEYVSPLKLSSKIAFLDGKNCAPFCSDPFYSFFEAYGLKVDILNDDQVRTGVLSKYDLLIVPGGPDAGESYYEGLGQKGYEEIRSFINNGGMYLGSCAGSYFPLTAQNGTVPHDIWLNMLPVGDKCGLDYWRTGTGFVRVEFEEEFHPVTNGLSMGRPSTLDMIYWEGPAFDILNQENISVIARFRDFIASGKDLPSWSLENNVIAQEAMKWSNPLTKERFETYLKGFPAIIEAPYGKGYMVLISPHAEFGTCGTDHHMKNNPNYLLLMNSLYYLSSK